jgi:hypothetical protein
MRSVTSKPIMLSVVMLNVVMLSVVAPKIFITMSIFKVVIIAVTYKARVFALSFTSNLDQGEVMT